jgi:hypothetical protein
MGALLLLFAIGANAAPSPKAQEKAADKTADKTTEKTADKATEVMGFQTWKTGRVDEAKSLLERLQQEHATAGNNKRPEAGKNGQNSSAKSARSDAKLLQAQLSLEVARELTVNDYFVLYLSQFKTREAFLDAAKKLNPEESADLMISYQKHLASGLSSGAGPFEDLAPSAAGLAAPSRAANKPGSL